VGAPAHFEPSGGQARRGAAGARGGRARGRGGWARGGRGDGMAVKGPLNGRDVARRYDGVQGGRWSGGSAKGGTAPRERGPFDD